MEKPSSAGRSIPEVAPVKHINHTPFPSQYFQTVDQYGRAFHVIATRITYDLQHLWGSGYLSYAAEQSPLAMSDVWDGEPNESSPLWESDFAPYKPKCDVLVANAVSRPPEGKPGSSWRCGIAIDWRDENGQDQHWHKELLVTGPRAHNMLGDYQERLNQRRKHASIGKTLMVVTKIVQVAQAITLMNVILSGMVSTRQEGPGRPNWSLPLSRTAARKTIRLSVSQH